MTEDLLERWIEALESGKYKQTQGRLRSAQLFTDDDEIIRPEGFCCLGVLCDLVDPNGWTVNGLGEYIWGNEDFGRSATYAPNSVINESAQTYLSGLNDAGSSFADIASAIHNYGEDILK